MSVTFKDNSKQVFSQFEISKVKALTAIGQTAVEITNDYMEYKYGRPIRQTGDLIRSIAKNVRIADDAVDIGSNLNYALWVHEGTARMAGRPFLRDAILENRDAYKEVAAEHLGEGFKGININISGTSYKK